MLYLVLAEKLNEKVTFKIFDTASLHRNLGQISSNFTANFHFILWLEENKNKELFCFDEFLVKWFFNLCGLQRVGLKILAASFTFNQQSRVWPSEKAALNFFQMKEWPFKSSYWKWTQCSRRLPLKVKESNQTIAFEAKEWQERINYCRKSYWWNRFKNIWHVWGWSESKAESAELWLWSMISVDPKSKHWLLSFWRIFLCHPKKLSNSVYLSMNYFRQV